MKHDKDASLVFPSAISVARSLSENTLNQALRRMGFDGSEQATHGFWVLAGTLLEKSSNTTIG